MTKFFILGFNLFILFSYKLFFGGEVSVEQKMPTYAKAGESFTIEIEIEKGDREGFAKWQQKLPEGLVATKLNSGGATFSFKDQEIKLIWMSLPAEEKFTISYTVESSPDLNTNLTLQGKFSYIEENERKEIIAKEASIFISPEAPVEPIAETEPFEEDEVEDDDDLQVENDEISSEETRDNTEEDTFGQDEPTAGIVRNQVSSSDLIQVEREIIHLNDGNYQVNLTIEKNGFKAFGKIEEYLPPNYIASEIESSKGIFSFKGKVMKILWMALPEKSTINVSYGLQSTSSELDSAGIFGLFSFLNDDESVQIPLKQTRFKNYFNDASVVANTEEQSNDESTIADEEILYSSEGKGTDNASENVVNDFADGTGTDTDEKSFEEQKTDEDQLAADITNIPDAETTVNYKVQIAASKKEVQQQYFIDRHSIQENVSIEYHENWYKYTVGSYNVYKQARDKRNEIWGQDNKINDAFVTAYNAGNRISVQEALMITKQKWYN